MYINTDKLKAHIQYLIKKDNYELFDVPELLSFIDSNQQEQPEVDLEKEIVSICETYGITKNFDAELGPLDIKNIARHFYELGINARKEQPAQVADASKMERLNVDDLHEWSMRYAPGFREMIEATAYHFWNLAICSMKEE